MGDKSFFKPIGEGGDRRLRFRIRTRLGRIVEFLVQLEVQIAGTWLPVVRYDNAHGFAHRDVLDSRGRLVEKKPLKLATLGQVLEFAEQDLLDRVDWYIERFVKGRKSR
ncbi:MAG: hypothetical protein HYY17_13915 [Planctomycetes bacterium]|nr:hypothetical protein [Planctomycetota bacterium]